MSTPYRRRRIFRYCSRLVYVAVGVGLLWLTAARWNGMPADPTGAGTGRAQPPSRIPIDPAEDRTREVLAALQALPPEPNWTLPPAPEGMCWAGTPSGPIDPYEIVDGPWTPETRPHMQAVIQYLETPAVRDALGLFAAIPPGGCRISDVHTSNIRRAAKLLGASARYHHAGRDDIDAAIDNLLALLRFSEVCFDSGKTLLMLTAEACEQLAFDELRLLAFERHLSADQAERIRSSFATLFPDRKTIWQRYIDSEVDQLTRFLNAGYTVEGSGGGWLVLGRLQSAWAPTRSPEPRCGAWNLLSCLFNGRRTVAAKIRQIRRDLEAVHDLPFKEAHARLTALKARNPLNILDGPLYGISPTPLASYQHRLIVSLIAWRRAAITAVALAVYRHDYGVHPDSLTDLLDRYLDAIPLDPFDDQPIRYIPLPEEDDFLLYCVGPNGVDDGGRRRERKPLGQPRREDIDMVFTHERRTTLYEEIELEKIQP